LHIANFRTREKFAQVITTPGELLFQSLHMRKLAKPSGPRWFVSDWLKAKGMKQVDLVHGTDHDKSEISLWVSGKRRFNADVLEEFARIIGVSAADLLRPPTAVLVHEALLVGKVGAGAEIHRVPEGVVMEGVSTDFLSRAPNVAEIEGDSQYPLKDRWRVYYGPENEGVADKCVGNLCVVQVTEGPTLLKTLKRGKRKGYWDLESWNAPTREDVRLEWAAIVEGIQPR
jgi:hypothetical protein